MVPPALQERFFTRQGNEWELERRIRRMVSFIAMDLIRDEFPGGDLLDLDLILCRNVFIYFDTASTAKVAGKLAASLSEGGYLMTGHTALIGHQVLNLKGRLFPDSVVFQRLIQSICAHWWGRSGRV